MRAPFSCLLCGDSRNIPVLSHGNYVYVRCSGCGFIFLQPFPESSDLLARYDDCGNNPVSPSVDPSGEAAVHRIRFSEELDRIEEHARRGRVLDIGCAWGFFLELCRQRGWQVQGVELSHVQADYARQRFGLEVFTGALGEARFPDGHFDVVTLWHVLEHIHDPLAELREIRRVLKPEGIIVVTVPTPRSAPDYVFSSIPLHLFYFNESTLGRTLQQSGFRVMRTRKGGGTGGGVLMKKLGIRDSQELISRHVSFLWPFKKILQRARCVVDLHKEITVYATPQGRA